MGVAELRELRQLRHENRKLKQLVADLSLDKHMLQEVLSKKVWSRRANASVRNRATTSAACTLDAKANWSGNTECALRQQTKIQ